MSDAAPDFVPTTTVIEETRTTFTQFGTPAETVTKMVSMGWEVTEETPFGTAVKHPLITGTTRYIQNR